MYPVFQVEPFAPEQRDLEIRSIVKFPYLLYVPIICDLVPIAIFYIKADTTVLVGALFVLGKSVKCVPINLVPLKSRYSRRWLLGQQVQLLVIGDIHETCLQPTAESLHVFSINPIFTLLRVFRA